MLQSKVEGKAIALIKGAKHLRIAGETQFEGAKRMRIEGETRTEGKARKKPREGLGRGSVSPFPEKF